MASVTFAPYGTSAHAAPSKVWPLNPLKIIARWNLGRQTRNVLSTLTDRQLHDIGLVRGDIDELAFGHDSSN